MSEYNSTIINKQWECCNLIAINFGHALGRRWVNTVVATEPCLQHGEKLRGTYKGHVISVVCLGIAYRAAFKRLQKSNVMR